MDSHSGDALCRTHCSSAKCFFISNLEGQKASPGLFLFLKGHCPGCRGFEFRVKPPFRCVYSTVVSCQCQTWNRCCLSQRADVCYRLLVVNAWSKAGKIMSSSTQRGWCESHVICIIMSNCLHTVDSLHEISATSTSILSLCVFLSLQWGGNCFFLYEAAQPQQDDAQASCPCLLLSLEMDPVTHSCLSRREVLCLVYPYVDLHRGEEWRWTVRMEASDRISCGYYVKNYTFRVGE